jgi:hypothetical protein
MSQILSDTSISFSFDKKSDQQDEGDEEWNVKNVAIQILVNVVVVMNIVFVRTMKNDKQT